MNDFLQNSAFMGVAISLVAYAAGAFLRRKFKSDVFNPLLIAIAVTILFLAASKTDYDIIAAQRFYPGFLPRQRLLLRFLFMNKRRF